MHHRPLDSENLTNTSRCKSKWAILHKTVQNAIIHRYKVAYGLSIVTERGDLEWPWTTWCRHLALFRRSRQLWGMTYGDIPYLEIILKECVKERYQANSAFRPSGVGKWVPSLAGKAKAGMVVHSVSGWTRGVQVKLWDTLRTRAIPERLRGVFMTRRYTNPRLPYLAVPLTLKRKFDLCNIARPCQQ